MELAQTNCGSRTETDTTEAFQYLLVRVVRPSSGPRCNVGLRLPRDISPFFKSLYSAPLADFLLEHGLYPLIAGIVISFLLRSSSQQPQAQSHLTTSSTTSNVVFMYNDFSPRASLDFSCRGAGGRRNLYIVPVLISLWIEWKHLGTTGRSQHTEYESAICPRNAGITN